MKERSCSFYSRDVYSRAPFSFIYQNLNKEEIPFSCDIESKFHYLLVLSLSVLSLILRGKTD